MASSARGEAAGAAEEPDVPEGTQGEAHLGGGAEQEATAGTRWWSRLRGKGGKKWWWGLGAGVKKNIEKI